MEAAEILEIVGVTCENPKPYLDAKQQLNMKELPHKVTLFSWPFKIHNPVGYKLRALHHGILISDLQHIGIDARLTCARCHHEPLTPSYNGWLWKCSKCKTSFGVIVE
jgi:hypothetical protein